MRRHEKHGHAVKGSESPEYLVWCTMRQRCSNPNSEYYACYGGRGIRVCESWNKSFVAFHQDLGPRPGRGYSIDRKDNDGHYSCGKCEECVANGWDANCRWATQSEQARNNRWNRLLTLNGETMCLADWARRTGLERRTIAMRLKLGWTVERALTERLIGKSDVRAGFRLLTFEGETLYLRAWARRYGISSDLLSRRLKSGWPLGEALRTPASFANRWRNHGRKGEAA